ncbi:MAG: DsbA family protein [Candidatus Aenigmarchaeota archaeon]|nr:DsbA family protein [Candidatus Aenigmarchaeota archaeon]
MAEEKKEETVVIKKSTLTLVVVAVVFLAVGFGIGKFTTPTANVIVGGNNNPPSDTGNGGTPSRLDVPAGDAPVLGDSNAKVTIIEYSDYECPFCGRFYTQTEGLLRSEYIDTGKAKLVYKDFPLSSIHPTAQKAAEAARCAGEQGKYWEMHDLLFEKQDEWAPLGAAKLRDYATGLGLDAAAYNSCLDTGKYASAVQKDFNEGSSFGVSGTPSFFINGFQIVGAQPYSVFKQIIDQELQA